MESGRRPTAQEFFPPGCCTGSSGRALLVRGLGSLALISALGVPLASAQEPVPIGTEFQVNSYTTNAQASPSVDAVGDGSFIVAWVSTNQVNSADVFAQRFDTSGSPAGSEFKVNSLNFPPPYTGGAYFPGVGADQDGNFIVAWSWSAAGAGGLRVSRFDATGTPLGESTITSGPLSPPPSSLGADDDGDFVVVWDSYYNPPGDVRGTVPGELVNTYTTGQQSMAAVGMDPGGDFVAVWSSDGQDGDGGGIFAQRYDAASVAAGAEFQVNSYTTGDQFHPVVARDDAGYFFVAWEDRSAGCCEIAAQMYDPVGNPLGGEFQVALSGQKPAVASDSLGGFVVVWDGVSGRRFDSTGGPLGDEFEVNLGVSPDLSADADGNLVVVYHRSDGGDFDVWGQRLALPGLRLDTEGSCPGTISVDVSNAPPNSEIALVTAANTNGFVKGGSLCPGVAFRIGEPFTLPPTFVLIDSEGNGSTNIQTQANRCLLQALAFADCSTSGVVRLPGS